jgi:excisionase family DNA binding protein
VSTPTADIYREVMAGQGISLRRAAKLLSRSDTWVMMMARSGQLEALLVGKRYLTSTDAVDRYLRRMNPGTAEVANRG